MHELMTCVDADRYRLVLQDAYHLYMK
jgi:hypothetical protein